MLHAIFDFGGLAAIIIITVIIMFFIRPIINRSDWKQQIIPYTTDGIFVLIFVCALIFHSHQTEATYRLDFIWKLQATGECRPHCVLFSVKWSSAANFCVRSIK